MAFPAPSSSRLSLPLTIRERRTRGREIHREPAGARVSSRASPMASSLFFDGICPTPPSSLSPLSSHILLVRHDPPPPPHFVSSTLQIHHAMGQIEPPTPWSSSARSSAHQGQAADAIKRVGLGDCEGEECLGDPLVRRARKENEELVFLARNYNKTEPQTERIGAISSAT